MSPESDSSKWYFDFHLVNVVKNLNFPFSVRLNPIFEVYITIPPRIDDVLIKY